MSAPSAGDAGRPVEGARPGLRAAPALGALLLLAGCSTLDLQRAAYESAHTVSDLENRDAPGYRSEPRDFDDYRRRRGEILGDGGAADPMLPEPPPAPAAP